MCTFVIATLPSPEGLACLERHHFGRLDLQSLENKSLHSQLRAGETTFTTNSRMCDCGTAIGSARVPEPAGPPSRRQVAELKKRGRSENKVNRWLDQKKEFQDRPTAQSKFRGEEIASWFEFLHTALVERQLAFVGVLHHTFHGDLSNERIAIAGEAEVALAAVTPSLLAGIEEDTLVRFVRRQRR